MRGIRGVVGGCFQVALILFSTCASSVAQTAGTLTLVEGGVALIRGATQYTATQGVGLRDGDILAVGPKGQAQIEFQDGAILNISQGGSAMLTSVAPKRGAPARAAVAVLSGWVKFSQPRPAKGSPYRYITPVAEIASADATGVLSAGIDFTDLFVESGTVTFYETGKRGAKKVTRDAKGGEFIARRGEQAVIFSPRPSAEFIKNMPRHFRDNLPVLLDRLKNRKVEPKRDHEVTYAEVEAWLKADSSIRRPFVRRFEIRSHDSDFRRKLIENLQAHPEWDRVLFPEKYEPKDPNDPKRGQPRKKQ